MLRKIIFNTVSYILAFLSTYFSMIEYSSVISSSCMNCIYIQDVASYSLMVFPFFYFLTFFFEKINVKKNIRLVIITIVFIFIVLNNNLNIFIDRVSSWSTYTIIEEILATIHSSYVIVMLGALMFFFFCKRILY